MTVLDTGTFRLSGGPVTLTKDGTSVRGRGKRRTQYSFVDLFKIPAQAALSRIFYPGTESALLAVQAQKLPVRFVPGCENVRLRTIS
jgi:hypothetical protein